MELYFTTTGKQFLQLKSSLVGMNIIVRGSLVCGGGGKPECSAKTHVSKRATPKSFDITVQPLSFTVIELGSQRWGAIALSFTLHGHRDFLLKGFN